MAHAVDTDLIRVTGDIARIKFDGVNERKLKPTHGYIRKAIAAATRELGQPVSVAQLATDWFNGHPFLIWAMLAPTLKTNQSITPDNASDLIDEFLKNGGKSQELQNALVTILAEYLHVEVAQKDDEDDDPNAQAPNAGPETD